MDSETKQICSRKNYKDISMEKIIKNCLITKNQNNNILALYMSEDSMKMNNEIRKSDRKIQYVDNEYCKEENLKYYLTYKKKFSGLFQKYIHPLNDKNFIIEVEWTNKIIQMFKKTNNHSIFDKIDNCKKLAILESGYESHVTNTNLSNQKLFNNIKEICIEIKRRINSIYYFKNKNIIKGIDITNENSSSNEINILKSMKLHFRIDSDFNIFLLYCTNLEFFLDLNHNFDRDLFNVIFKMPCEIELSKVPLQMAKEKSLNKNAELNGRQLCLGCDRFVDKFSLYKIDYKKIIENYEIVNKNFIEIPNLIKRIHGNNIKEGFYDKFKKYDNWLKNETEICDECFLDNTKL